MQLFIREIKFNLKSLVIWSISMILLILAGMAKYGLASNSGQSFNELASQMPAPIKAMLGFGSFDLSNALGYFGIMFFYITLMLAAHASMLGADILSKEERDKTTEYIYVKPISRNSLLISKISAAILLALTFNLISTAASIIIVNHYGHTSYTDQIVNLMPGSIFIQLIFLFIGLAIASISKNPKTAVSITTSLLLSTFILSVLIDLNSKLSNLKYLTPFKYFPTSELLDLKNISATFTIISLFIIATSIVISFIALNKRDLKV